MEGFFMRQNENFINKLNFKKLQILQKQWIFSNLLPYILTQLVSLIKIDK